MIFALLFAMLFSTVPAFSSEVVGESRFHLLSTRCEVEANEGPEPTPQSPPLEVDDPSTPGCNRWEINVLVDGDITRSQKSWEVPLLDINYGIGDNIQLKYEQPYMNSVSQDGSVAAVGESKTGIKYMFFEDERSNFEIAAYPQLSFVSPSSDAAVKGLVSPGSIVTLPVLLSTKIGRTSHGEVDLTANLGYNISTRADTANFVSAAVGVGTMVLNKLSVMGELTSEQAVARVSDQARAQLLKADIGVMTTVSKQFLLFGAVGHSLVASDLEDHTYVLAGFQLFVGGSSPEGERVASQ